MTESGSNAAQESHLAQAAIGGLRALLDEVVADLSRRNDCKLFVSRLLAAYDKQNLDALDRQLSREPESLERLYPRAEATLREVRVEVERRLSQRFRSLTHQLAEYSESRGRRLKGISPNFVVDGLVEVVLDGENRAAKVGASYIRTLDWDRISDLLDTEWGRVWGRPFDAAAYRDELLSVYETIMRMKPNPSGWAALGDVYQKLKEHREEQNPGWRQSGRVAGYYKDEFSADLSKVWQAQMEGQLTAPHVELSAHRDPRRAYQVVLADGSTAKYGFLRPQRA